MSKHYAWDVAISYASPDWKHAEELATLVRKAGYRGPVRSCETVTLTYIARMEAPGVVGIYSYTKQLRFAALPGREPDDPPRPRRTGDRPLLGEGP